MMMLVVTKEDGRNMKKFLSVVGILAFALLVAGCKTSQSSSNTDLAGTWSLTMPSGFKHKVHITRETADRYRFSKAGVIINGIYERRGNRLVMITPSDSQLTDWIWRIDDGNHLTLVKEPDVHKTGGGYRASTLQR